MQDNPNITKFSRLHNLSHYAQYLQNLLIKIKKNSEAEGFPDLLGTPYNKVPSANQPAALLEIFAKRSKRTRQLLSNVAYLHVVLRHKILIFARNLTKQELINCFLNLASLASEA
jgi:hypothetical protein